MESTNNPKIQQQYDPEFLRLADNVWTTVAEVCGDRIARKISYDEGVKALLPHLEAIQLRGCQQNLPWTEGYNQGRADEAKAGDKLYRDGFQKGAESMRERAIAAVIDHTCQAAGDKSHCTECSWDMAAVEEIRALPLTEPEVEG